MSAQQQPRRRGRPALVEGDTSTPVCVKVSTSDYDRASAKARQDGVTVPTVMRRALTRLLDDDDDEE